MFGRCFDYKIDERYIREMLLLPPPIREQIINAAKDVRASIEELSGIEGERIRSETADKFARGRMDWLWERYTQRISVQNAAAWTWIGEFVAGSEVIMFSNVMDDKAVFVFADGTQIVPTLRETYNFEFYGKGQCGWSADGRDDEAPLRDTGQVIASLGM